MEELNIVLTLKRLEGFDLSPIERVLIAHTGTVQLLLSLWFREEVKMKVKRQWEQDGNIARWTSLYTDTFGEVCSANSVIPLAQNAQEILEDVRAKSLGLGQIVVKHRVLPTRTLMGFDISPTELHRTYVLEGDRLRFTITESFSRECMRRVL